jgi:hypothetical protein
MHRLPFPWNHLLLSVHLTANLLYHPCMSAAFFSGALREVGVALCRGNASLGRSGLYALTRASCRDPVARPLLSLG